MKREIRQVDGTPSKRLFWSIISDYSLNTAICELIDNALDIWLRNGKTNLLSVLIDLDTDRQIIKIQDCAGGVAEENLQLLISPGASGNDRNESVIGLFGVGSKRAVVALAEEVKITTRHKNNGSFQIDIDENWLSSETWEMPIYEVEEIDENTTVIDLCKLRRQITTEDEFELIAHLCETYANFLKDKNFEIKINGTRLQPVEFDVWAYPPGFQPRYYQFNIPTVDNEEVGVEITAGLIREKESGKDDYGVYFYCNDRLIVKEIKDREVGYAAKLAGVPHFDASLARIIVKFYGAAKLMPWNSSKSSINYAHHMFKGLQTFLIKVVTDYSSLSRRLKGQWDENVFPFSDGELEYIDINDVEKVKRTYLPPLPKIRKNAVEHLKNKNKLTVNDQPWTLGLLEAIAAVEIIARQKLETKNRIALILLDSNFEIALKEYIVANQSLLGFSGKDKEMMQLLNDKRYKIVEFVSLKAGIDSTTTSKIKHYYSMRNKLIHEKATVGITDADVTNYQETIQKILTLLFNLKF